MKSLPKFIANFVSGLSLTANKLEEFIKYFIMWNIPQSYNSDVVWFEDGKQTNKFTLYKLPLVVAQSFLRYGRKQYSRKEQNNLYCQIVRSDMGISLPLHIGLASLKLPNLQAVESFLTSFDSSQYINPSIHFSDEGRVFMGRIQHVSGEYSFLISGSCNEQAGSNLYIEECGMIAKVGRSNKHTLNFDAKHHEQLDYIMEIADMVPSYQASYVEAMKEKAGSFDQFYSRIFLKGKSVKGLKGRAKGLYNGIFENYEFSNDLYGFFLACSKYDNSKLANDYSKILIGSYSSYSLKVMNYIQNNSNIQTI